MKRRTNVARALSAHLKNPFSPKAFWMGLSPEESKTKFNSAKTWRNVGVISFLLKTPRLYRTERQATVQENPGESKYTIWF